jgi:hypothetical protein
MGLAIKSPRAYRRKDCVQIRKLHSGSATRIDIQRKQNDLNSAIGATQHVPLPFLHRFSCCINARSDRYLQAFSRHSLSSFLCTGCRCQDSCSIRTVGLLMQGSPGTDEPRLTNIRSTKNSYFQTLHILKNCDPYSVNKHSARKRLDISSVKFSDISKMSCQLVYKQPCGTP